jgi:hypothetical protein
MTAATRQLEHDSPIYRILEKIVSMKLTNHLELLNKLINKHQYGFLCGKLTEYNLLYVINNISAALNENKYSRVGAQL